MRMRPYDIECIVLGTTLRYGKDAAQIVLPQLTPDKFIFNYDGSFGVEHGRLWAAISETFLSKKQSPTLINVLSANTDMPAVETRALVDRLEHQYKVFEFDPASFEALCDLVDKAGIVYNVASQGAVLSDTITDVEAFIRAVNSVPDIEQWLTERLTALRGVMSRHSSGYVHVSTIVNSLKDTWERQFSGEEMILPNNGFPSLRRHKLFPMRRMSVVHGLSGSGKSSFVFQICLGVAIDLFLSGRKGCVAINSLEMEQESLVERLASILSGVDVSGFINGTMTKGDIDKLLYWVEFVAKLPIFVDPTNFVTTSAMTYRASGLHVSEHGPVTMLASDYGELFKDDEGQSEEQRVNQIFREHFRLSRLINAAIVAISQSTTDRQVTGKTYIAGADGTRYSRGILQATDILTELWNPLQIEASGRTIVAPQGFSTAHPWLFVQKYRQGATGAAIPLGWRPESTTFFDLDLNFGATKGQEVIFSHLEDAVKKWGHLE